MCDNVTEDFEDTLEVGETYRLITIDNDDNTYYIDLLGGTWVCQDDFNEPFGKTKNIPKTPAFEEKDNGN